MDENKLTGAERCICFHIMSLLKDEDSLVGYYYLMSLQSASMPEDTQKKAFVPSLQAPYLIIAADLKGCSLESVKAFSKSGACFIKYLIE